MTARLFFADGYRKLFKSQGLDQYESLVCPPECEVLRLLPDRANIKFKLSCDGHTRTFYLKKHPPKQRKWTYVFRDSTSPGIREFENAMALKEHNIPCYEPVAAGESRQGSLFVSEDIYGGTQLDHYLQRNRVEEEEKRQIIDMLADVAIDFHQKGFHHKDFYLCHFFYTPEHKSIRLIDLQRAVRRPKLKLRQQVKDLAALYYSISQAGLSFEDWMLFFEKYSSQAPLIVSAERLMFKVAAKTEQICRHDTKSQSRNPPPVIHDNRGLA